MKTVAVRIPREIEKEMKVIIETEGLDKSAAFRKILEKGLKEWKKELALKLLQEGRVTLWKSAKIAGLSIWEMLDLIEKRGAVLPIRAEDVIEDIRAGME
jgi:predicted HTH domain antitoxin